MSIKSFPLLRVFTLDKLVKSRILNLIGIQPFRIQLAKTLYNLRKKYSETTYAKEIKEILSEGMIKIENFLPEEQFQLLESECKQLISREENFHKKIQDGPNLKSYVDLHKIDKTNYPYITKYFINNDHLVALFQGSERRKINLNSPRITLLLEVLEQGNNPNAVDPETDLHSDTFFNTHKSWLYLTDVNLVDAPFTYVPKSHNIKITKRLAREYKYSLEKNPIGKGSRRISQEELSFIGLSEVICTFKKNTLLLANTFGYHRRMMGKPGGKRVALVVSTRFNPFK